MNVPTCVDQGCTYIRASQIDISASLWNLTEKLSQKSKKAVENEDKDKILQTLVGLDNS